MSKLATAILALLVAFSLRWPHRDLRSSTESRQSGRSCFSRLGAVADRKVSVEWNRFYDHAGLGAILAGLHKAFPDLTALFD